MLSALNHFIVAMMDFLLGWLLHFPSDVQLIAVAILSALVLTGVRFWTTDQDLLRRCRQDKARLKTLIREAKTRRDQDAVTRHHATLGMIELKQLRQEARPLLASLMPIVMLATWALSRLEFHPLKVGEPVKFAAYFPISAVGKIAHIVPDDSLTAKTGWIQEITATTAQETVCGCAIWDLSTASGPEQRRLQVRFNGKTFEHSMRVGTGRYELPLQIHDANVLATELKLRPVKLFGVVPGIPALNFPAWLTGYLVLVIPITFLLRKMLRVR